MENKFGENDRVKIINDAYCYGGLTGHISEVEGNDFIPHETPYKVRGFWYRAVDLVLIADADVIENARHGDATDSGNGDDGELVRLSHALEHAAHENVTLLMELAEALGLHRHEFLDADGDEAVIAAIEALRNENARLKAALAPFAMLAQYYGDSKIPDSADAMQDAVYGGRWVITYGQLRAVFAIATQQPANGDGEGV